jgi:Protein of unknown function (DUF3106)
MPRRIFQLGFVPRTLLLAPLLLAMMLVTGSSAFAQRVAPPRVAPNANAPKPGERRMLAMPPAWVDRLRQMTPQQQERFFNNNERFRELPPERQAQMRQQLQQWNRLSPDQRQTMLDRQQVWDRLTPEQQGYVRETLLPQWQKTPPARRQMILGKLRQLRGLDDAQHTAKLGNEAFLGGLNPEDRQMLRDLSNLRVGPEEAGEAPAEP